MKKKLTALGLVLAVVASLFAGMTLTYFTDKDTVANTFTVGNVDIEVTETNAPAGNLYKNVVPGVEYAKNPTIKNVGRNDAYARMLVTVPKDLFDALAAKGVTNLATVFGGHDEAVWAFAGSYSDTPANTMTYVYNYKGVLTPNVSAILFDSFTLPKELTQADLAAWESFYIVVEGQAIQKEGFVKADGSPDADAAFAALDSVWGHAPTVPVTDQAELNTAISAARPGDEIALLPGEYELPATITDGVTITGNGATVTVPVSEGFNRLNSTGVTFKDVVFADAGKLWFKDAATFENCTFNCEINNAEPVDGTVKFVDCTFNKAVHFAPSGAAGVTPADKFFKAENCNFNANLTVQGFEKVTLEGCTLRGNNWAGKNMISYCPVEATDCTFTTGIRIGTVTIADISCTGCGTVDVSWVGGSGTVGA